MNKTILKQRLAVTTAAQYIYVGFFRRNKIPRCNAYDIEKAIRFQLRLQLDVRNLSLGRRHLVNAYEVEAGTV